MRANEFINEGTKGSVPKRHDKAQPGAYKFRDNGTDRTYHLNQIMKAVAMADGSGSLLPVDAESWIGKDNSAQPYTKLEQDMMKQAAKSIGSKLKDSNHGNLRSMELDTTNKSSPVQAFKGFGK